MLDNNWGNQRFLPGLDARKKVWILKYKAIIRFVFLVSRDIITPYNMPDVATIIPGTITPQAQPPMKQILIAEDDRFLSSLLKAKLEKEGMAVLQAFDGEEVLMVLKKNKPNLILLDVIMPKVSGFEVLHSISLDPQVNKIPVMMLTNLAQDSDMEKAKALGAKDYLVKVRNSIDQLVEKVKVAVA